MKNHHKLITRSARLISAVILMSAIFMQAIPLGLANAAQITSRSLTLQAGAGGDAGAKVGGIVNHDFKFTLPGGSVGSVVLRYCTLAGSINDPCTTPTGLDTTTATAGTENGAAGFTVVNTTNGQPYFTRTAAVVGANTPVELQLVHVTNPTTDPIANNATFFVRIATYTPSVPNIATDTPVDTGTVAATTVTQIQLSGTMPESLVFCAGATIDTTGGVPDCSTVTTGLVNFDKLFSPTDTSTASSQMAASTNAGSGYSITVNGPTLTSGSNTITPISSPALGVHGVSQFGMNLVANTTATSTPAVGANITAASNGTNYRGEPTTDYSSADHFKYADGDPIADSASGGAGGTDAQIYTASYIVNVPGSQPAGTYVSTLTFICTPTF
jgi:hypothetical protein